MTTVLHYRVVDVFSRHAFGGNPLAVFVDVPPLDAHLMRSIARQMNLSETVYARPAADPSHLASFRIFTPTTELPIAGHPTIGATAVVLAERFGDAWPTTTAVELAIGPIDIDIEHRDGAQHLVWMNQGVPVASTAAAPDAKKLYHALGLEPSDGSSELETAVLSVGVPILIVPVRDEEALDRASPTGLPAYFAAHPPVRIVYLVSESSARSDISARMFGASAVGIEEDPATGVAAGPLAAYLHRARRLTLDAEAVINQGHAMGRSSYLHIRTDGAQVFVGGQVMNVASGELTVDPPPDVTGQQQGAFVDELKDRTAVVIGGGGGIGRGVSLGLAHAGMNVVVADIELDSATRVAAEITGAGMRAIARRVDATSARALDSLAETTVAEFGAVHVLSNNVGVILNRRLDEATEAEWSWFFEFNVMSIVRGNNAFLPHLRAHGEGGHIVITSSMAGLLALEPKAVGGYFNGLYTTTKHALIGYCEMLRMELEPERIGVSVLCPGLVAGNLSSTAARNRPERFGGPLADPRAGAPPNPAAMPNDAVGPLVVDAIRANRFYIFTHPDSVALVRTRQQHVLDDFEFYRSRQ